MRNSYRITDFRDLGLPSIEVAGHQFHYQDLYEMVGQNQFMTTFELKNGSVSYNEYGDSVLGVIFYDRKSIDSLERSVQTGIEIAKQRIRIDSPCRELSVKKKGDLRYRGISVDDIEAISFLPYIREKERYETGEKKVPNIIEVTVDCSKIDADILNQNYLASKHNDGTKLIQYEKEQLIGITLAFNNGRIDSRLLAEFGFTEDDLKTNLNIWMSLYKVKERRNQLTEMDKKNYSEIRGILSLEKFNKLMKKLVSTGISASLKDFDSSTLKNIFSAVETFSPSILMHGKKQVYWDLDSYIHIALRHLKDFQFGHFKLKTPFSYKKEDLKSLIEKVLQKIDIETEDYLGSNPTGDFTRHGKMGVEFNRDHFHLRINKDGRLTQFHTVEPSFNKANAADAKSRAAD
ncbi:hypothetical protein KAR10_00695 [bacterium]|nr:hypothetical protein [bacterium]